VDILKANIILCPNWRNATATFNSMENPQMEFSSHPALISWLVDYLLINFFRTSKTLCLVSRNSDLCFEV